MLSKDRQNTALRCKGLNQLHLSSANAFKLDPSFFSKTYKSSVKINEDQKTTISCVYVTNTLNFVIVTKVVNDSKPVYTSEQNKLFTALLYYGC